MPDVKKVVGIHRPEAQKAPEMSEMTEDRYHRVKLSLIQIIPINLTHLTVYILFAQTWLVALKYGVVALQSPHLSLSLVRVSTSTAHVKSSHLPPSQFPNRSLNFKLNHKWGCLHLFGVLLSICQVGKL